MMRYTPEEKERWDRVMARMEEALISKGERPLYNVFIKPLKLYKIDSSTIYVSGDNNFNISHMRSRYGTMIYALVCQEFNRKYEIEYYPENIIERMVPPDHASKPNKAYTFDNFITGASNNFAYASSLAVAQMPGDAYNPLFIYGGVGLGKTHLINAIGNYINQHEPRMRVLLMTSEAMTNELIESIAKKNTSDMRARLRATDVLMVDDVQFLGRTKSAQEEFFNTFNELYNAKKQIIIASDRPPKELPEIEERLRSRFSWGVIVDIQKPDFETRVAILMDKVDRMNLDVPYEVVEYIARNVTSNIRDLEGCLQSLSAHMELMDTDITMEMAVPVLAGRISTPGRGEITVEFIMDVVASQFDITVQDIIGKKRSQEIAMPRQICMYICRRMTSMSTTSIGKAFGGRDHTTVMHGCEKIAEAMEADFAFKKRIEDLIALIEGR